MLPANSEIAPSVDAALLSDPRWQLVLRVVDSKVFYRCEQLQKLLLHIAESTIEGRHAEINEQHIGVVVYKRSASFDSAADTIVRSHASRLRQKLASYFRTEGQFETLRITIPRGGYVPEFHPALPLSAEVPPVEPAGLVAEPTGDISGETETSPRAENAFAVDLPRPNAFRHVLLIALAASILTAALMLLFQHRVRSREASQPEGRPQTAVEDAFWRSVLPHQGDEKTLLVISDSGLSLYETMTGTEASLEDYLDGEYQAPGSVPQTPASKAALELSSHRYTTVVDTELVQRLTHLNQWSDRHASMVFARDLRAADAAKSNLILLGSRQGNPWLALAEPSLNFVLVRDGTNGFQYLNKKPRANEQAIYAFSANQGALGAATVYGYIAYLKNPGSQKRILALSGMWVSGTQSAGNFALDSARFSEWLSSIRNSDGTIPSFELLLSTKSLQGNATYTTVAASRTYHD